MNRFSRTIRKIVLIGIRAVAIIANAVLHMNISVFAYGELDEFDGGMNEENEDPP